MDNHTISTLVRAYLSDQLGCAPEDLSGSGTLYVSHTGAQPPFIRFVAFGGKVIVSASPELLPKVRALTEGRSRDEIFELPLVYGQTIHYVPGNAPAIPLPEGFTYRLLEGQAIYELTGLTGFPNSLAFDEDGRTGTGIVCFALSQGKIAALAGAGQETEALWEMGVDTAPAYRGCGLGSGLTAWLTRELLERERVPFYSASVTNIGSQLVAGRCGLKPCWVDTYSNILLDDYIYKNEINHLLSSHSEFV